MSDEMNGNRNSCGYRNLNEEMELLFIQELLSGEVVMLVLLFHVRGVREGTSAKPITRSPKRRSTTRHSASTGCANEKGHATLFSECKKIINCTGNCINKWKQAFGNISNKTTGVTKYQKINDSDFLSKIIGGVEAYVGQTQASVPQIRNNGLQRQDNVPHTRSSIPCPSIFLLALLSVYLIACAITSEDESTGGREDSSDVTQTSAVIQAPAEPIANQVTEDLTISADDTRLSSSPVSEHICDMKTLFAMNKTLQSLANVNTFSMVSTPNNRLLIAKLLSQSLSIKDNSSSSDRNIVSTTDKFLTQTKSSLFGLHSDSVEPQSIYLYPFVRALELYLDRAGAGGSSSVTEQMRYEIERLQSFSKSSCLASPIRLSANGFYATGSDNETRCFSCGTTYSSWMILDKPEIIHQTLSPGCPHLNGSDERNIPIAADSSRSSQNVESAYGLIGVYPSSQTHQSAISENEPVGPNLSSRESTATLDPGAMVHPQYRDIERRMNSFQNWNPELEQTPTNLSAAGFFYAGYADCVRCFYCGVGLRTWEPGDDPWVEHVRWRSSCGYIRRVKGEDFVIRVLAGAQTSEQLSVASSSTEMPAETLPSSSPTSPSVGASCSLQQQQAEARQDLTTSTTDAVLRALEMGYSNSEVQRAVEHLAEHPELSTSQENSKDNPLPLELLLETLLTIPRDDSPGGDDDPSPSSQFNDVGMAIAAAGTSLSVVSNSQEGGRDDGTGSDPRATGVKGKDGEESADLGSIQSETGAKFMSSMPSHQRQQLMEENQQLREESTCKICLDNPSCIVFLPCGHFVSCAECAPALQKCPICRAFIRGTVRTYTTRS